MGRCGRPVWVPQAVPWIFDSPEHADRAADITRQTRPNSRPDSRPGHPQEVAPAQLRRGLGPIIDHLSSVLGLRRCRRQDGADGRGTAPPRHAVAASPFTPPLLTLLLTRMPPRRLVRMPSLYQVRWKCRLSRARRMRSQRLPNTNPTLPQHKARSELLRAADTASVGKPLGKRSAEVVSTLVRFEINSCRPYWIGGGKWRNG
jgi:hypothetical protein